MATTGEVIKWVRAKHGLTQDELGNILGVKKSAIQKYESGAICNFKADVVRIFFLRFHVPPWALFFPDKLNMEILDRMTEAVIDPFFALNERGQEKLTVYLNDMLMIEQYRES